MIAFPFQRDSSDRAARIRKLSLGLPFSVVLLHRFGAASTGNDPRSERAVRPDPWSVILAAGESQTAPEAARAAFAQLCHTYWPPLYTFVRSRGYAVHDAQDLTQSFFAHLIEHKLYARVDRQKGKFRSFLLASLKNLLADTHDRAQTLKRGGGRDFLPLDEEQIEKAESLFQTHGGAEEPPNEDRVFERTWAETLVTGALARSGG